MKWMKISGRALRMFFMIVIVFSTMGCGERKQNVKGSETEQPQLEVVSGGSEKEIAEKEDEGKSEEKLREESKETVQTTWNPEEHFSWEAVKAYRSLQGQIDTDCSAVGVAMLGYVNKISDVSQLADFWKESSYSSEYPFLSEISNDSYINMEGNSLYVFVPRNDNYKITVYSVPDDAWQEGVYDLEKEKLVYEAAEGEPVLVLCNDIQYANVRIAVYGDGQSYDFHPSYHLAESSVEMEFGYYDFTLPTTIESEYFFGMNGEWVCDDLPGANGKKYFYRLVMQEGGEDSINLVFSYAMEGEDYFTTWGGMIWCEDGTIDQETFVCGYSLETPDGERSGTIKLKHKGDKLTIQEGKGDAFFPFTNHSKETFYFLEFDGE